MSSSAGHPRPPEPRRSPAPAEASFLELLEVHAELGELFALHQECLLVLELGAARGLLASYRELVRLHAGHEEELLLPIYRRLGPVPRRPELLYTGQHAKMLALLEGSASALASAGALSGRGLRRRVLSVLELETAYKHLAEHHDDAEQGALYPGSDRASPPGERDRLLRLMRAQWRAAQDPLAPAMAAARRALDSRKP